MKVKVLLMVFSLSIVTIFYQNCGGSFKTSSLDSNSGSNLDITNESSNSETIDDNPNSDVPPKSGWVISPAPQFKQGSDDTYNLVLTLPSDVKPNGTFGVDTASGPDLPVGMLLDPDTGTIYVNTAATGITNGVVFTYTEPN